MTEVVTDTAASLQQSLVAERQQRAFGVSGGSQENLSQNTASLAVQKGAPAADAVVRQSESEQSQSESRRSRQAAQQQQIKRDAPDPADQPRPSRSVSADPVDKIEIKDFDVGRRAAEVVGTADVVQRFDNNLDGRVDLLESQRATRARDTSFTYAARGQAHTDTPTVAEQVQDKEISKSVLTPVAQNAPVNTSTQAQSESDANIPRKIFNDVQVNSAGTEEDGVVPKKLFAAEDIADQGAVTDGVPVQQKFFGEGAEVVLGRFATDADVQQKLSEKAEQFETGRFYEGETGEEKLYDKVAQSEPGRFAPEEDGKLYGDAAVEEVPFSDNSGGGTEGELSLYEKAQQVAQRNDGASVEEQPDKKIYGELDLYSDVAGFGEAAADPVTGQPIPTVTA
ncbi:MAG: hypothetical protein RJS98_09210 [Rhodospirillaceae bacterium]